MAQFPTREQLAAFLTLGLTSREIAKRLGMSQTNVRHWLKKHGLRLRPRRGPRPKPRRCDICGDTDRAHCRKGCTHICAACADRRREEAKHPATKQCTGCGEVKPIEDFPFHNKRLGKRLSKCGECARAEAREYYARTLPKQRARATRLNQRAQDEVMAQLMAYLQDKACVDCGERDLTVLEFDHVTGEKAATVSALIGSLRPSWERVLAEIQKCEIRCVNCHRRKTARERGYFKSRKAAEKG